MKLKLIETKALDFSLKTDRETLKTLGDSKFFDLDYTIQYEGLELDMFAVFFEMKVGHPNEFLIDLIYLATFKASEDILEEDKGSPFFMANAPAIAFPFLRGFIGTVTLNAGYSPVMLPSINFVELAESKKKQQS